MSKNKLDTVIPPIRISKKELESFESKCKFQGKSFSEVLRSLMFGYQSFAAPEATAISESLNSPEATAISNQINKEYV